MPGLEEQQEYHPTWCARGRYGIDVYLFGKGKGTHAFKMLQRFCMCHLSTGDLLRYEVRSGSEFGKRIKETIDKGDLVGDEIICGIIQHNLNK